MKPATEITPAQTRLSAALNTMRALADATVTDPGREPEYKEAVAAVAAAEAEVNREGMKS